MMMRKIGFILILIWWLTTCTQQTSDKSIRSAYYWSTTFDTDTAKLSFYKQHHISRLYVRYFDVVKDNDGKLIPNATIEFKDQPPKNMEIVPTVFIVNNCMQSDDPELAGHILKRILQMNKTHDIEGVKEIQIDCDWTKRTEAAYYRFLTKLRDLASQHGIEVSATIRLHQLAYTPPPISKGTLMVYNTGDFTRLDKEKPILDIKDVKPYLHYLKSYDLPLNAAYPIYRWQQLFRQGKFAAILYRDDQHPILPTDSIVTREPSVQDIQEVQHEIQKVRKNVHQEIILFDINKYNISRYKHEDYEKIYHP